MLLNVVKMRIGSIRKLGCAILFSITICLFPIAVFSQTANSPFSIRLGINLALPYVRTIAVPANPEGQISDFWSLNRFPGWYTADELRQAGYDFVRIPVNPVVLLENPPAARVKLLDKLEEGMKVYLNAGLRVIVDLHFWNIDKTWSKETVVSDRVGSIFVAYRLMVNAIAERLANYPRGQVALELMNEPPDSSCQQGWIEAQKNLLKEVRKYAADLPVVIAGCGGQLEGLIALKPVDIDLSDPNLIFTFHFYEPFLFTHQGGYKTYQFIEGLRYPASDSNAVDVLKLTNANIESAPLTLQEKVAAKADAIKLISRYLAQNADRSYINGRFDKIAEWASLNHISSHQILLGEFAAINWRKDHDSGDYKRSRVRWDNDVLLAAQAHGIATAYWMLPYPKGPVFR